MIKSMTGYGSGTAIAAGKAFTIEVRCVNHRYSDFNIKCPRVYTFAEDEIKRLAGQTISRGKADVYMTVENRESSGAVVRADVELAKSYHDGLLLLAKELGLSYDPRANDFLWVPDVFQVEKAEQDDDVILAAIREAMTTALESFDAMRRAEGERLYADMNCRLDVIAELTDKIEARAPSIVAEYKERIETRMRQIMEEIPYDESRLLSEVAIFSDRVNVNEELVRLKSHIAQMRKMLTGNEPVGRKLDFLIQEMNREINTVGSKSNDLDTAKMVIDIKAEIEKLREQCQNVE